MYIARQPIVDAQRRIVAFELLFRSPSRPVCDGVYATAMVTSRAFADYRLDDLLGGRPGFINVDSKFLASDMIEFLPPERAVIELLEDTVYTPEVVARCQALKGKGYTLAADDYAGDHGGLSPVLAYLDIVKVDLRQVSLEEAVAIAGELDGKKLLAEKVETVEEFERCAAAGYQLFQGYFIAKPAAVAEVEPDPGRLAALKVLAMLMQDEGDAAIESEIKRHPAIGLGLLRIANSAAAGLAQPISNLRQALLAVGRKSLERWMQILVYLGQEGGDPGAEPVLQLAGVRARTMEKLARKAGRTGERAFLVGLVSLFDVALGLSRDEVARRLSLDDEIRGALREEGELGALFSLALALESGDDPQVERILQRLPSVRRADLIEATAEALRWASALGKA